MVRFSCFPPSTRHHKSKKVIQHSGESLQFVPQVTYGDQAMESFTGSASSNPKIDQNNHSSLSGQQNTSSYSHEDCWKSEDLNSNSCLDGKELLQIVNLKKSQSLGNMLSNERGLITDDVTEDDELDQGFSLHYLHHMDINGVEGPFNITSSASAESYGKKDPAINSYHQHQENLNPVGSLRQSDEGQDGSAESIENLDPGQLRSHSRTFENLFSIGGSKIGFSDCEGALSHAAASYSHNVPQVFDFDVKGLPVHADPVEKPIRSNSSSGHIEVESEGQDGKHRNELRCENQSNDGNHSSCYLDSGEEYQNSSASAGFNTVVTDKERDDKCWMEKSEYQNQSVDVYISHYACQAAKLKEHETGGAEFDDKLQQESLFQFRDELTLEEFKIKRINDWLNQIDLQNGVIVEELGESSSSASKREPQRVAGSSAIKLDSRSSLGMELAYNYISNLKFSSSSAQLSSLGLVAIPILGAFLGLRVLSLSGNSIGALPKGLHKLNLSKNNISVIEGFRDLTRLRVLDLSYNRISRIGHGLASCSVLKELYLAGNKISEVEGLHRLLKLHILDLRSNKISTPKALGQLAGNYASLQVIILEGNPAQKNVGDEHLKKYLLSILPHLVHYNKQSIRAHGSREVSDRSRNISSHQFDRSERSEAKFFQRKHLTAAASSSTRRGLASLATSSSKQSKSRNAHHLSAMASKPTDHLPEIGRRLLGLEMNNPIRRIRSEEKLYDG